MRGHGMKLAAAPRAYARAMERTGASHRSDTHRLFFGLWPDDEVRAALHAAAGGVDAFRGRGRRVDASKLHLTLHFLGGWPEWPEDVVARCRSAAGAVSCGAFHLVVDHAGGFPRARVGWLAPSGNSGLDALWSSLSHALDDAGVAHHHADTFAPHVTVLRAFDGRIDDDVAIEPISWPVDAFVLVHSHGGRYEITGRWPLDSPA
jgi:2'-5' RNA ligase